MSCLRMQLLKQCYKFIIRKINMRNKVNKDDFTPWQIIEETNFTSTIVPELPQPNSQAQHEPFQFIQIRHQPKERKHIQTIKSLAKLKLVKQIQKPTHILDFNCTSRKKQNSPILKVRPLNGNLINIINTFYQNDSPKKFQSYKTNTESHTLKLGMKKNQKYLSKHQSIKRNYSQTIPGKVKVDFQTFKRNLIIKVNPSLQNLLRSKEHFSKLIQHDQLPILRSYSVHNIGMNAAQQNSIKKINISEASNKIKSGGYFSSTLSSLQSTENMKNFEIKPRINSSLSKNIDKHVIDRLYDKLY